MTTGSSSFNGTEIGNAINTSLKRFDVTNYGAIGDGVTDDTTSINAAISAAEVNGGIVYFPYGSYNFTYTPPATNVFYHFESDGIPASYFGGSSGRYGKNVLFGRLDGPHTSNNLALQHIYAIPKGSGANGAQAADYAQTLSVLKEDWQTTDEAGEIDGQLIYVRNGGSATGTKSSTAGQVIDVGGLRDVGFIAERESMVTQFAPDATTIDYQMNLQYGVINSRDSDFVGLVLDADVGTFDTAILAKNVGSSTWTDFVRIKTSSGFIPFKISMEGKIVTKSDNTGNTEVSLKNDSGVLQFVTNNGTVLGSVGQDGFFIKDSVESVTSAKTITASSSGMIYTNEGTTGEVTLTLPTASKGLNYQFIVQDIDGVKINALSRDTIRIGSNESSVDRSIQASAKGCAIKLVAINSTEWVAVYVNGVWTVAA